MDEAYYAGAYWGPRKESADDCARRLGMFITALPAVDASFVRWFQTGKSRKDALKRLLEPELAELEKFVARGRDPGNEDLGFGIAAWNGASDEYEATGFDIHCGGYSDVVLNTCVFTLPSRGLSAGRVVTASALVSLLRACALSWEPDWAVAMSHAHREMTGRRKQKWAPRIGWVTYLAQHRGTVPPLPAPVRIESVEDKGTLIVLTPERFTASNPEHVALAERVRELLDRAGLLKPLQAQP
ncbi:immunity 52 family protein [Corallococcus terminator]